MPKCVSPTNAPILFGDILNPFIPVGSRVDSAHRKRLLTLLVSIG